jgi:hypothetical protein
MSRLLYRSLKLLEPYEGKLSRTVLRGESGSNSADLPDKAIASPLMAGYLFYLYKTVRKFWGEAIVVTQELGDIIGNAVVKDSIINNSDTICLLDQTKFKDNYKEIAALLSINETERKKIFTINQLDNAAGARDALKKYISAAARPVRSTAWKFL